MEPVRHTPQPVKYCGFQRAIGKLGVCPKSNTRAPAVSPPEPVMHSRIKLLPGIISFLSSFFCVLTIYRWAPKELFSVLIAVYGAGLLIGVTHGMIFSRRAGISVFTGTFAAVLGLWSPVVIGTYGFAILGLPLLIAYGVCVAAGALLGARAKRFLGRRPSASAEERQSDSQASNQPNGRNGGSKPRLTVGSMLFAVIATLPGWFASLFFIAANNMQAGWFDRFILALYPLLGLLAFQIPSLFSGACAAASTFSAARLVGATRQ